MMIRNNLDLFAVIALFCICAGFLAWGLCMRAETTLSITIAITGFIAVMFWVWRSTRERGGGCDKKPDSLRAVKISF